MGEKIVSLRTGKKILAPGEPSSSAIELCEKLLVMAKSGEIQGLVVINVHSDGATSADYNDGLLFTYQLAGRMLQMSNSIAESASNRG